MRIDSASSQYREQTTKTQAELSGLFDEFTLIESPAKIQKAREIAAKIGTIDFEMEGLANMENQRDLSIKFHWGHDHRFNDTFHVAGRMGDRHLNLMAQFMTLYDLNKDHFLNKDVIDVGCWTGGTTLLLKAMGAREVLALEEVQKYAQTTEQLAVDLYAQEGVRSDGTNLYDLAPEKRYDIAYFPGVIYHLSDPVLALRRLFIALKDGGEIFVESAGLDSDQPICQFEGNRVYHKQPAESAGDLNRGGWNWFLPSPSCLARWMMEAGFNHVSACYSPQSKRVFAYGKRDTYQEITRAGLSDRNIP